MALVVTALLVATAFPVIISPFCSSPLPLPITNVPPRLKRSSAFVGMKTRGFIRDEERARLWWWDSWEVCAFYRLFPTMTHHQCSCL